MITVKLLGGYGNQLFEAAYGMALEARGYEVAYDKTSLVGTREYALAPFGPRRFHHFGGEIEWFESSFKFNEIHLNPLDPCKVIGYFQSERYFENIVDKVRTAFDLGFHTRYVQTIAIHVRRGDYVNLQHYHGMPSIDYYREAVAYIRRKVGFLCPVTVVSDDLQWCIENFPSDFVFYKGRDKYEDMKMIASCDYQIISNSTFGWWGSWLGPQKLVIAPKKWFADPSIDSSDVVPERWTKI